MPKIKKENIVQVNEENAEIAAAVDFDSPEFIVPIEDDNDGVVQELQPISQEDVNEAVAKLQLPPKIDDPKWTSFVLSQFEPNELEEGLPKVDGLRRMVRKLIGPIVKGGASIKQCPTIENDQRATVEYTLVVYNKYQIKEDEDEQPYEIEFTDVADAYRGNIRGIEYARFPSAMASTRAEVRALRKALNLAVVGIEETSDQPLEEAGFTGKITESQITKIDIKCDQLDINVVKFINMGKKKYNDITEIPNIVAVKMFAEINQYQQYDESKENVGKPIPKEIRGYNPNWRAD